MTVDQLCSPTTVKYLLDKYGFRFSKSMGQNFLIDSSVPVRIADAADLDETVGVLEVGAGFGCLTAATASYAGKVVCVELDTSLQPVLAGPQGQSGQVLTRHGKEGVFQRRSWQ